MENYKLRVNNEAESKEVSMIASDIGFNIVGFIPERRPNGFLWVYLSKNRTADYSPTKELTLPELRDLVVLKRNDVNDATHEDIGIKYYVTSKGDLYQFYDGKWGLFIGCKSPTFTRIKNSKTMKEYLNEKYELITAPESEAKEPHAKGWLEVPEGAEVATASGLAVYFWKPSENKTFIDNVGWSECDGKSICTLDSYLEDSDVSIIWKRNAPTLPEELPFIDNAVNHPEHYTSDPSGIECIQITRHRNFNIGNAMKYLWRNGLKDSDSQVQDLEKAIWYIRDEIQRLQGE